MVLNVLPQKVYEIWRPLKEISEKLHNLKHTEIIKGQSTYKEGFVLIYYWLKLLHRFTLSNKPVMKRSTKTPANLVLTV